MDPKCTSLMLGLLLASCTQGTNRTATAHFRFDVSAIEHGIRRTGSSTWRLTLRKSLVSPDVNPVASLVGEATPIRLQDGSWLFFLPLGEKGDWGDQWVLSSFGIIPRNDNSPSAYPALALSKVANRYGLSKAFLCDREPTPNNRYINLNSCPIVLHSDSGGRRSSIKRLNQDELKSLGISTASIGYSFSVSRGPVTYKLSNIIPWIDDLLFNPITKERNTNLFNVFPVELQYLRKPLGKTHTFREEAL